MRRRKSVPGGVEGADDLPTTGNGLGSSRGSGNGGSKSGNGGQQPQQHHGSGSKPAPAAEEVQAKEAARSKIIVRVTMGALLVGLFFGVAWAGHIYIFLLICVRGLCVCVCVCVCRYVGGVGCTFIM